MKFDSARDEVLSMMANDGWGIDHDGDVDSPTGWFAKISTNEAELSEVRQAFEDDAPEGFNWDEIVGHFLLSEDSNGLVKVEKYATQTELDKTFRIYSRQYGLYLGNEEGL